MAAQNAVGFGFLGLAFLGCGDRARGLIIEASCWKRP
jgi:hypothetical protein